MGTLSSAFEIVRLRIKENKVNYFTDADLVKLSNDIVEQFYALMKAHEALYIISTEEITLTSASDYAISSFNGLIWGQVFTEAGVGVPRYIEPFDETFSYFENATGITFYNHSDLEGDKISARFWDSIPSISGASVSTEDLPWSGDWNEAIKRALTVECQEIREKDNSRTSVWAQQAIDDALNNIVNKYGTLSRRVKGSLNV